MMGANITAIDCAPTALRKIAETCLENQLICPTLVCADMQNLPLADSQFDAAQCFDAIPQVWDTRSTLLHIARTLRPGGELIFNVFTPRDCAYGEGEQIEANAFLYSQTLFRFFEESDMRSLMPECLEIVESVAERWEDPPHVPFRPYSHIHDGIYYICRKVG
jgi:ubiquinone/menaquinone biosynthesis C-methylase UbiE